MLVADALGRMRGGAYFKLGLVAGAVDEMNYPREPTLLFDDFFCVLASSCWTTRVAACLSGAFCYEDLEDLQDGFEVLLRCYSCLTTDQRLSYFTGKSSSSRVGLRTEEGVETGKCQRREDGHV